jgi:multidrug efflux pump subunit AcrA (membrane-fusion protein)
MPDPGWDSEVLRLLQSDVAVRLADAPHTRDELLVARERVWELTDTIPITAISIPVDGTVLSVCTDAPAETVQAELDRIVPGLAAVAPASAVAL